MNYIFKAVLFISLVYSIDSSNDILLLNNGEKYLGSFIRVEYGKVYFKDKNTGSSRLVRLKEIKELTQNENYLIKDGTLLVDKNTLSIKENNLEKNNVKSVSIGNKVISAEKVNHLNMAGKKLQEAVIYQITGVLISLGGDILALNSEKSQNGYYISYLGSGISLYGLLKIYHAGSELKNISSKKN